MNRAMRYAGISGAIAVVLAAAGLALGALEFFGQGSETTSFFGIVTDIVCLIFSIPFLYGFIILGEKTKNRIIVYSTYASIVLLIPGTLLITFFEFYPVEEFLAGIFYLVFILLVSLVGMAFGAGILMLRKDFGRLATAAGVLDIICGLLYLTIILTFLGALLSLFAMVLEAALLLRAADKF